MKQIVALLVGIVSVLGCGSEPTQVRLAVEADPAWALDGLYIALGDSTATLSFKTPVMIELGDDTAGSPQVLHVFGQRAGTVWAQDAVEVTPILHEVVDATAQLVRVVIDACDVGTTRCDMGGVVTCLMTADGTAWGPPTPCTSPTPECTDGMCVAECSDECTSGESDCEGATGVITCGQFDNDSCLDWSDSTACPVAQTCTCTGAGICTATCSSVCTEGATRCDGTTGMQTCIDTNSDDCFEWGPTTACGSGLQCTNDACQPCTLTRGVDHARASTGVMDVAR